MGAKGNKQMLPHLHGDCGKECRAKNRLGFLAFPSWQKRLRLYRYHHCNGSSLL